jgi:GNAT superfamily N-acetyltransferase
MPLPEDRYGLLPVIEVDPALLATFKCGKAHLDGFLAQAPDFHRARLGLTTVAFHRDIDGIVGYFTLANDSLPLTTSEQLELNVDVVLKAYPAVKLGRLAVASHLQGQGIGEQLMSFIHGEILDSESLSAARLVIVDADHDERVIAFYRGHGYQESLWAEAQAKNHRTLKVGVAPATVKMIRDILA